MAIKGPKKAGAIGACLLTKPKSEQTEADKKEIAAQMEIINRINEIQKRIHSKSTSHKENMPC